MPNVGDKRTVDGRIQTWDGTRWVTSGQAAPGTHFEPPGPPTPTSPAPEEVAPVHAPGALPAPNINDPIYDLVEQDPDTGEWVVVGRDWSTYYLDMKRYQDLLEGGTGDAGPTAAELAIEQSKVQAANMANYLDGVIRGVEAEVSAGRLSLEQAEAEFNRRMDALSEAGTQMASLWQWTVPEGAGALHPDIRANLGMEPWESQPMTWDPYALAQQIIAETPELTGPPISTDPIQEAIEMAQGLI